MHSHPEPVRDVSHASVILNRDRPPTSNALSSEPPQPVSNALSSWRTGPHALSSWGPQRAMCALWVFYSGRCPGLGRLWRGWSICYSPSPRLVMTAFRLFVISACVFLVSACGLLGVFFLGFRYFTYQGTRLDWIYPTGGLCVWAMGASGFTALVSGVAAMAGGRMRRKIKSRQT